MTVIYLLHVTVGFVFGFLAATATIKAHVASRDHVRNRIIGAGLVILAILSVIVGVQQTRRTDNNMQRQLSCEHKNAVAQDEAHATLMAVMDRIITTPPAQRTPTQYDELANANNQYLRMLQVQDQTQCQPSSTP